MMTAIDLSSGGSTSKREMTRAKAIKRFKWITISPVVIVFLVVLMPALILQLYFSFFGWTVYLGSWWDAEFVGLELFQEVLTDERLGWAIIRSLYFSFGSTIGCFVVGFGLALLMYKPFRGNGFYYIMFIIPMLTVPIVVAYTGEMLLYQKGPINGILSTIFGRDINVIWLADANLALTTVMLMEIWNWTPFSFIIMIAGLASLPKEPQEAAQILGAGKLRVFFEIQLPLLRPVIILALILRFLEAMAEYPKIWSLFQGGPGSSTETIPVLIYLTTWNYFEISKGAAMSYVIMLLMVVIVLAAIWVLRREKSNLDHLYK
ncbi:MAG: carbohydrate ABC transporter permease [Pseudomonadales bacterium]|jgi:multiple sugar transport system permease protein|tara:strand:- start:721 stop:1677 length:957 start_codon:yes stop_codon:yes gene_type:complete